MATLMAMATLAAAAAVLVGVSAADEVVYAGPGADGAPHDGFYEILSVATRQSGCCRTASGDSSGAAIEVFSAAEGTWPPEFWGRPRGAGLRECIRRCAGLHGCVGVEIGAGASGAGGLERCELYLEAERPAVISNAGRGCAASLTGCFFRPAGGSWDDERWNPPPDATGATPGTAAPVTVTATAGAATSTAGSQTGSPTPTASGTTTTPTASGTTTPTASGTTTPTASGTTTPTRTGSPSAGAQPTTTATTTGEGTPGSTGTASPADGASTAKTDTAAPPTAAGSSTLSTSTAGVAPTSTAGVLPTEGGGEPNAGPDAPPWWPPVLAVLVLAALFALYARRRTRQAGRNDSVYDDVVVLGDSRAAAAAAAGPSGGGWAWSGWVSRASARRRSYIMIAGLEEHDPEPMAAQYVAVQPGASPV